MSSSNDTVSALRLTPPALGAQFGGHGFIIGLAMASLALPDGCAVDATVSERLRILVPLLTACVLTAAAWLVAPRRHTIVALALIPVALATNAVAIGILVLGVADGFGAAAWVALRVLPAYVATTIGLGAVTVLERRAHARGEAAPWQARLLAQLAAMIGTLALWLYASLDQDAIDGLLGGAALLAGVGFVAAVVPWRSRMPLRIGVPLALAVVMALGGLEILRSAPSQNPPLAPAGRIKLWGC